MKEYSDYQKAIFNEVRQRSGNVAINAVAGSGKTTTCIDSLSHIPSIYTVQFCAFGRDIANELKTRRLPRNVTIATYNAFGWRICRQANRALILDADKTDKTLQFSILGARQEDEASWKRFQRMRGPVRRLVSLLKSRCTFDFDNVLGLIPEFVEHYQIDTPEDADFNEVVLHTYKACVENKSVFDFDDQVFQVLYQGLTVPCFQYVFVDEFQDTNEMQARLMQEACKGGRFFGVGDPDQSIYGFRGATPDAFGKFVRDFQAKEMPLSICYRCPKKVVAEAKKIVPRIEPAPWAREGTVDTISTEQYKKMVGINDFVLCRTVAPLVKRCLEQIRLGRPATVLGRDIGDQVEYLIDKASHYNNFERIEIFRDHLGAYIQKKIEWYDKMQMEAAALALDDKYQTILALAEDCHTVGQLKTRISQVFSEEQRNCIKYMSVHKSKGLECDTNVFLIRPDLLPHPKSMNVPWMREEERRLEYVACTRTKMNFFRVTREPNEK